MISCLFLFINNISFGIIKQKLPQGGCVIIHAPNFIIRNTSDEKSCQYQYWIQITRQTCSH